MEYLLKVVKMIFDLRVLHIQRCCIKIQASTEGEASAEGKAGAEGETSAGLKSYHAAVQGEDLSVFTAPS